MDMNTRLREAIQKIESWDKETIRNVLEEADGDNDLKKALTERYQPLIKHMYGYGLETIASLPEKIADEEVLKKQWEPDPVSVKIMNTMPVEEIRLREITEFPFWITHLNRLKELYIYENQMEDLPFEISRFKQLEILNLSAKNLKAIPEWVCDLSLIELHISFNELESIPDAISRMTTLERLYLHYNKLTRLPDDIGKLVNLEDLNLSGNQLSELPQSMSALANLERLEISSNKFTRLPDAISGCSRLSTLKFDSNDIAEVPNWIGSLKKLGALILNNTKVNALPPEIRNLDSLYCLNIEETPLQQGKVFKESMVKEEVHDFLELLFAGEKDPIVDIYRSLESRDGIKIENALSLLNADPAMRRRAEKRYLGFIQARLNNGDATLSDFPDAALSVDEQKLFFDENIFGSNFISFHYLDGLSCKLIVDFAGGIVRGHLDIDEYCERAKETADVYDLMAMARDLTKNIKRANLLEAQIYSGGWFGKICGVFAELDLSDVRFDHTQFSDANSSLVLKEFYLFLSCLTTNTFKMDIFQSDIPELTEIFWMLELPPTTIWGDVDLTLPKSELKYIRSARVKIGDFGGWDEVGSELARDPEDLKSLLNLAKYYHKQHEITSVEKYLDKCLKCNSEDHQSWFEVGSFLFDLEEYERAIVCYKNAVELNPKKLFGWYNIGICFNNLDRHVEAIPYFEKWYALNPEEKTGLFYMAYAYNKNHEYDKSRRFYLESVEAYPDHDLSWYNLACHEALHGDHEKAIIYLQKAIALDSKYKSMADEDSDFDGIRGKINQLN